MEQLHYIMFGVTPLADKVK